MNPSSMTRRQFSLLGASALLVDPMVMVQSGRASEPLPMRRVVRLPDGSTAPASGMGSWRLAQGRRPVVQEKEAVRLGLSPGMTLIDTAEMYGNGVSEQIICRVIAGRRADVFLVSKVQPSNATTRAGVVEACARSLRNRGTDYLDLYLLHRRGQVRDQGLVVGTFEALKMDHVRENARAMSISLGAQDLAQLDKAFPV